MTKLRLLLLDANVVIELFRLGIWERVIERCEISLARTIVDESYFYADDNGDRIDFDLSPFEASQQIIVFDVTPSRARSLRDMFDSTFIEKLDAGEVEALCHLLDSSEPFSISSADAIVYRVLGNLNRGSQGISLEEILQRVGFGRALSYQFTKAFRDKWTARGFAERMQGQGKKC
jgi:hypothetical protein